MTLPLIEPADLVAELGNAERLLVAVDFDGTLAPIVDRPDDATAPPGATDTLRDLSRRTSVAVLSGRSIEDLMHRLPDVGMTYAGGHGAQIREPGGATQDLIDVDTVARTLDDAETALHEALDGGAGWFVERKASSLAVHHRLVPEDEERERLPRVQALLEARHSEGPGFAVLPGKSVIELRPNGVDKGKALDWIAERHTSLTPIMFGDDATDEDAFRAAVTRGGRGVLVASTDRPSLAQFRVAGPAEVVQVLRLLADTDVER